MTADSLPYDALTEVLEYTRNMFEACQVPLLLLQQTGYQAKIGQGISGTAINTGVMRHNLTEFQFPMLKSIMPTNTVYEPNKITFVRNNVPVFIKIINRNYKFLQNPDTVLWQYEAFQVPNPWDDYYRVRYLIKWLILS